MMSEYPIPRVEYAAYFPKMSPDASNADFLFRLITRLLGRKDSPSAQYQEAGLGNLKRWKFSDVIKYRYQPTQYLLNQTKSKVRWILKHQQYGAIID